MLFLELLPAVLLAVESFDLVAFYIFFCPSTRAEHTLKALISAGGFFRIVLVLGNPHFLIPYVPGTNKKKKNTPSLHCNSLPARINQYGSIDLSQLGPH